MSIRVGFDIDGVVADFASAYREVEQRLFGDRPGRPDEPEREAREQASAGRSADPQTPHEPRRRRDLIWTEIQNTPNFWLSLPPIEERCVARIHQLMMQHAWEVFFITQRPTTAGMTVQRQTQQWLVKHGFDLPTVLIIGGSPGLAASTLGLHYYVDDNPQNCLDIRRQSSAKPLLITPGDDQDAVASARKIGIGVAPSLSASLDILEKASAAQSEPASLERLAAHVGWQ